MADDGKIDIEKEYEPLRKKYALPAFNELDTEFELQCIENTRFLLREVRFRIEEKADHILGVLEEIMQPDTKVSTLYESRMFAEKDKDKAFAVFKKLMVIKKRAIRLSILNNEKEDAEFIKASLADWNSLKKPLVELIGLLIEAWEKDSDLKENVSYLG